LADAWLEKRKIWGREYERYLPLLTMFYIGGVNADSFEKAIQYDTEHQREVARATYDAILVTEIIKLYEDAITGEDQQQQIWEDGKIKYVRIKTSELKDAMDTVLGRDRKISSQKIGLDCKRLQLTTKRYRDGTYIEDGRLVEKLRFYDERFALGLLDNVNEKTLEAMIKEIIVEISMEDSRGALTDVVIMRLKNEYAEETIKNEINVLLKNGELEINEERDDLKYLIRR
jgi:hypothetical protein